MRSKWKIAGKEVAAFWSVVVLLVEVGESA
jgi:hypothetical protein